MGYKNQQNVVKKPLTLQSAIAIVKDVFISAAERDIHTGDGLAISIITKDGVKKEMFPLRRDWLWLYISHVFFALDKTRVATSSLFKSLLKTKVVRMLNYLR